MASRAAALAAPVAAAEFDRLMARLGPFEAEPRLAIAVSGGPDSLALALLARAWARARDGEAVALTVDHRLRPEAAQEARRVGHWLAARGMRHHVLRWDGDKPSSNLQAAARAARYRLLEAWCRRAGMLHLLLAHQREDQAETLLLRLARGSGVDGLAAMAPVGESPSLRLLRPLLTVSRARLVATLQAARQDWIEDPSNLDPRHGRVRIRALMPTLAGEGLTVERLTDTVARLGRARQALEAAVAEVLARAAMVDPVGYAMLSRRRLAAAPSEVGLRALARLLQCVGGGVHTPRLERLDRLYGELVGPGLPGARTLGGCRVLRVGRPFETAHAGDRLLVCRESAGLPRPIAVKPGASLRWDDRFEITFAARFPKAKGPVRLAALGEAGWAEIVRRQPALREIPLPAAVRGALPALRDLDGVLAVPHLCYGRDGNEAGTVYVRSLAFRPPRPLAIGPVTVA